MDMRRILSMLLAIVMVVGMLPAQAFAAGEDGSVVVPNEVTTEPKAEPMEEPEVASDEGTYPALEVGVRAPVELPNGGMVYYTFTPDTDCTYRIVAHTDKDVWCDVYDTEMNLLWSGDFIEESYSGHNVELTANQTYILAFRYFIESNTGSFPVSVIHSNASYYVTQEPTCSVPGVENYVCDTCGTAWTQEVPSAHNYAWVDGKSANCTEEGYATYECTYCGDRYTETYPIWHDYANDICRVCGQGRTASGALNETTYWEYNLGTKTLTISGTGATPDTLQYRDHPWEIYGYYNIRHIVVEEGITRIGDYLLAYMTWVESISLPSTLKEIGNSAFYDNNATREIILPQGLTTIGNSAFSSCRGLEEIVIPESVTEIGDSAFRSCVSLRRAVVNAAVTEITAYVFEGCESLEEVILPSTLTTIRTYSFNNCPSLKTVVLPEGLERLENWAFYNSGLEHITLPASMNDFNGNPFQDCMNLQYIDVAAGSEHFISIDGALYSTDSTMLWMIPGAWATFQVPEYVTSLNIYAFGGNRQLQSLVFTGDAPHAECFFENIMTIYYPADNETWTWDVKNRYEGAIDWQPLSDLMILINPVPTETEGGKTFTMSVLVQGTGLSYQWQVSSDNGVAWTDIPGANGAVLEQMVENEDNGNYYRCVVTDAAGNERTSWMALLDVVPTFFVSGLYTTHYVTTTYGFDSYIYFTPDADGTYYFLVNDGNTNYDFDSMDGLESKYDGGYYLADMKVGETYKFRIKAWDTEIEHHEFSIYIQDRPTLKMDYNYAELDEGAVKEYVFMPDVSGTYVIYNDYEESVDVSVAVMNGDNVAVTAYGFDSHNDKTGYAVDLEAGYTYVVTIYPIENNNSIMIVLSEATPAYDLYSNLYEDLFGMVGAATNITLFTYTPTAARPNLIWTTSDPNVATAEAVEGLLGRLNFVGVGYCTITVTDADSGASTSFGVNAVAPAVLSMGDNTVHVDSYSTGYFSFTAEEAGTYVFHLPSDDYRWDFYRLDAAGNQHGMNAQLAGERYGVFFDAAAGETVYFALRNDNWNSEDKTLTVDMGIPAEQIGLNVDCIAGTLGGIMTRFIFEENILQIGAKYTAVSDNPSIVVAGIDEFGDLTLEFKELGSCHVTISTVNAAGETISKTITVKVKQDRQLVFGEYTLELMHGETEYFLFTPEESGYYVIYFPDLTNESWEVSIGQYDNWVNQRYDAAGSRGFMAWLDAGVETMIHVDNNMGYTDTQRFVFAKDTNATGIRVSQTEVTGTMYEGVRITAVVEPATFVQNIYLYWESSNSDVVVANESNNGREGWLYFNGVGTATVRVFNDDFGIEAFVTVTGVPNESLSLGLNGRWISSNSENLLYFKPEVSGDYALTYTQNAGHIQHVQTLDGSRPVQQSDMVDGTYVLTATLEAGVWYAYSAFAYEDCSLNFELAYADETTGITLDRESLSAMVGVSEEIHAHLMPLTSVINTLTWESSDEGIFTVDVQNGTMYAFINPVGAGEATLTVRTEEGHEVSIPVTVTMPPALEMGENEVALDGWSSGTYSFTAPADGNYVLFVPKNQGDLNMWASGVKYGSFSEYEYKGLSMYMSQGQNCFFYLENHYGAERTWTVTVAQACDAESISIVAPMGDTGYVGTGLTLYADVRPGAAANDNLTWTISDEYVGMVVPTGDYEASVYLVASGFADITVTTDSGLSATYRIHSYVPEALAVGDNKEVTLEPGKQIVYTFTPDADGWYVLYYGEEQEIFDLVVTDVNGDQPSYSFHSSGNRMAHRMLLSGGETYYLSLYHDAVYKETVTRNITLAKATAAESVTVTPDKSVYAVGDYGYVGLEQNPITAVDRVVDMICNNPDVLCIQGVYSDGFDFSCLNAGTATVTVIYESGYTTYVEITVSDYESLCEGGNGLNIPIGEERTYLFTPSQTGQYGLTTWDNPWWTTVTAPNGEQVERTDYVRYYNSQTRRGYLFELEAGVTYKVTVWNNQYGDFSSDWKFFDLQLDTAAEWIELNQYDVYTEQGGTVYLQAYIYPLNAYSAEITWTVEDPSILSVNEYGEFVAVGVGVTTVTATVGDASAVCYVTVNAAQTVAEGSYDAWMQSWGGTKSYRFVPEESGNYVFALDGDSWGMMMLFVYENGVDVTGNLEYYRTDMNMGRSLNLTAGKEYIICFINQNEWDYGGVVHIYRSESIQTVNFAQDTITGYVGQADEIYPWIEPQFAADEFLTVESSNPAVVSAETMYKHGIYLEYRSVGTATVTVTAASGASATLEINVTEIPTLTLGELVDVSFAADTVEYYQVTVETAGLYVLTVPEGAINYELYNADTYDHPYYSNNYTEDYLFAIYELEPGNYEVWLEINENLEGQVGIGPKVVSQTLDISATELTLFDGFGGNLFAILDSPFAIAEEVVWTSADEDVVVVYPQDAGGVWAIVRPMGLGQTTVTATLGDMSVTCTVTVEAIPELTEGEEVTVTSDEAGQTHHFTFTPETTGTYTFMASRSDVLVDLVEEYVSSSSGNLVMELYEGNTYTVAYRILNGGTGTFDVAVKAGSYCGMDAIWTLENGTLTISGTGDMFNYTGESWADIGPWINFQDEITNVVISDGITSIGDWAFLDLFRVKRITIPTSVTKIGDWAFARWYGLETVIFEGDAPAISENAFEECWDVNMIYPAGNETWTKAVMKNYGGNEFRWSDGAYLSFRYLQNEGSGYFNFEEAMFIFTEMESAPGNNEAVIFYSNIWDGQQWTVEPVEVQGNRWVTLTKIMDVDPDNIGSGAKYPEYYYFLEVTEDSWYQDAAVSFTMNSGRVLTLPITVNLPTHGFYSAPAIAPENYITYYEWDPDSTEDRVFYYGYIQEDDWVLVDVATEDMYGYPMPGHEFVTVEALENGMYKITVNSDAPDGFGLDLFVTVQNSEGRVIHYGFSFDCHAGESKKTFLGMYDLNWSEEGWYVEDDHFRTDFAELVPNARLMVLFAVSYVNENGERVYEPVDIQWTDGLTVTKIQDLEGEFIAPDAEFGQYYYQVGIDDWFMTETISYELNGEILTFVVNSDLPELAFYSAPEVSPENYIDIYEWDPDSDASRDFYYGAYGDTVADITLSTVDPDGNTLPGTENVTLTKLDNGMYKITVSPEITEEFHLQMWLMVEYADGSASEGSAETYCYPGQSYKCGDDAYWTFDEATGTLTISGTGAIDDYAFAAEFAILHLVIEDGITEIGNNAFSDCGNLQTVTMTDSVTTIGSFAFSSCSSLTTVRLSENLTEISDAMFWDCGKLTEMNIPQNITAIGAKAFVSVGLTSFVMPDTVTTVGKQAFSNTKMESITLSANLTGISEWMFMNNQALKSIVIPASVETIGDYAFAHCSSLTEITFMGDAPAMAENVFGALSEEAGGVTATVYYPGDNDTWTEEVMQQYGGTITWVPVYPTSGQCGENVYWEFTEEIGVLTITGQGAMDEYVGNPSQYPWYVFKDQILEVIVYESVSNVGAYAFSGYTNLQIAVLQVETIGDHAFSDCTSLTAAALTDNLTAIGDSAFAHTSITSINLPEGLTTIGSEAFMGSKLIRVIIPGTVTEWGNGAFQECANLKDATFDEGITAVPSYVFMGCTSLETVVIPSSVTSIGWCSFKGCSSLNNVVLPDGLTELYTEAFGDCVSLTSIEIPASVERMLKPFKGCTGLTEITFLGNAPMIVDDEAFAGVTATVYYPGDNDTWTEEVMKQYGGNLTWVATEVVLLEIIKQPNNVTANVGETVSFHVEATGDGLTYQWQYNQGSGWKNSSNGNSASLNVVGATHRNGYQYRCVITDTNGNVVYTDAATLTVK